MSPKKLVDLLRHREETLPPDEQYRLLLKDIDGLYQRIKEVYDELRPCRPNDESGNDEPIHYGDLDTAICLYRALFHGFLILHPMDESDLIELLDSVRENQAGEKERPDSAGDFLPSGEDGV